jgi:16S rRNA (cytosine967-C5)-methyltransferase
MVLLAISIQHYCIETVHFFNNHIMSKHHSHLNSAATVLTSYDGDTVFAPILKRFFAEHKKYGSKDRRQIGHLCYCYFRAIKVVSKELPLTEKILISYLLCTTESTPFLEVLKPEWSSYIPLSVEEKCQKLALDPLRVFPHVDSIEKFIDPIRFGLSHFVQPDLFLRIRPGYAEKVVQKLDKALVKYHRLGADCLALPNQTKIEEILLLNKEIVVQDYASQRVGKMLDKVKDLTSSHKGKLTVWDCCAASGGKSILAVDILGSIDLTVSDKRQAILYNLKTRFKQANFHNFEALNIDLSDPQMIEPLGTYDVIIADVPCSGSGTWSRTPERLNQCTIEEIAEFASLQKKITSNIQSKLKPGGFLLYITCSVYTQENSEILLHMTTKLNLELIQSEVLTGYDHKSDTMYAALLQIK